MKTMIMNFLKDEEGVTAIEYALIAALVAVAAIGGWTTLGGAIDTQADSVATKVSGAAAS